MMFMKMFTHLYLHMQKKVISISLLTVKVIQCTCRHSYQFSSVQSLSHVQLFVTP